MRSFAAVFVLSLATANAFSVTPMVKVCSSQTQLRAAAKKDETPVVSVRKAEFITKVSEKSGLNKTESEAALAAILDVITEVSYYVAKMLKKIVKNLVLKIVCMNS